MLYKNATDQVNWIDIRKETYTKYIGLVIKTRNYRFKLYIRFKKKNIYSKKMDYIFLYMNRINEKNRYKKEDTHKMLRVQ